MSSACCNAEVLASLIKSLVVCFDLFKLVICQRYLLMEILSLIPHFLRIFVLGLLSLSLCPSKLNAADFTLVEENYASFAFADKLSIFDETETFMYSVHHQSGHDHEVFQTYQLIDQQYKLISEYRLGKQYEHARVDTRKLKLIGNKVYALGGRSYVEFSIEDNTLQFVKHATYETSNYFFWNSVEINDSYILTFGNDNIYFWRFTEQGFEFAFEFEHSDGSAGNRSNAWLYQQESETLWKVQSGIGDVTLTSYGIDFDNASVSMIEQLTTDIIEPTGYDIKLVQYDFASSKFFIKTNGYELFLSISDTGLLNELSSLESTGGQIRGKSNLESFVELFYVDDSIEQFYKRINWQSNSIETHLIEANTLPVYRTNLSTWVDLPKFVSLISPGKALMSHPNGISKDGFSIHDVTETISTEPNPLSLGDFDKLPTRVNSKLYDPDTQVVLIAGKPNDSDRFRLYAWRHDAQRNGFDFIVSSDLGFGDNLRDKVTVTLVGVKGDNYYLLKSSLNDSNRTLMRVQLVDEALVIQESITTEGSHNNEMFFADENTIVFRHHSLYTLDISFCNLNEQNELTSCEQKTIFDSLNIHFMFLYDFFPINENGTFLFANNSPMIGDSETPPNYYILSFDKLNNDFEVIQTFQPPSEYAPSSYRGVDNIYVTPDALDLYVFGDRAHHYRYDSANSSWSFSGSVSGTSLESFSVHERGDYFLEEDGSALWLLDSGDHKFYRSIHFRGLYVSYAWYNLLTEDQGFYLGGAGSNHLSTFVIDNSKPALYKGNLPRTTLDILQDEDVNIDLGDYFINGESLNVVGLKENLSWDGRFITGHLTNDDMFLYEDISIETPAPEFSVGFYIGPQSEDPATSIYITPVNVNDPPEVTTSFATQYFKKDAEVRIVLYESVIDPDRENVSFSFQGLPSGMSGNTHGTITGIASRSGDYSTEVVAMDDEGASVSFNLRIIVNSSGSQESESSGGGGSLGLFLIVFVFLIRLCRYRV